MPHKYYQYKKKLTCQILEILPKQNWVLTFITNLKLKLKFEIEI